MKNFCQTNILKNREQTREKDRFTLIELLVKRSHLCCDRVYGKEEGLSPAHGQVKLYSFTCPWAGEAVQLHLNRASRRYRYHRDTGGDAYAGTAAGA